MRAALDFMAARYPEGTRAWCGGMSFGSWVGMTVGAADPRVNALIGIACPVNKYDYAPVAASGAIGKPRTRQRSVQIASKSRS